MRICWMSSALNVHFVDKSSNTLDILFRKKVSRWTHWRLRICKLGLFLNPWKAYEASLDWQATTYHKFVILWKDCSPTHDFAQEECFQLVSSYRRILSSIGSCHVLYSGIYHAKFLQDVHHWDWCLWTQNWSLLMQEGRALAFTSKALSGRKLAKSTFEKEMLAIIHVIQHWWPYLIGHHFIIKTDHHSLKYFLEQFISTPE